MNNERRGFLKLLTGVAGGLIAAPALAAELCEPTAPQTKGPFYPGEENIVPDNDLTRIRGRRSSALGEVIVVRGRVTDLSCRPVAGVNVEIWQACASGRYNHAEDPNQAPLDPNFKYWGETFTDANGEYSFRTIKPGAYPADEDWDRPPHIHFRVAKRGYVELITQMYFKGEPLNQDDLILQRVPARLRDHVLVDFVPQPLEPLVRVGTFDISIEKLL